ncbi:MAG: hypothetical protein ACSLFQ_11605 [Thermoanaerobaculia bacterium]
MRKSTLLAVLVTLLHVVPLTAMDLAVEPSVALPGIPVALKVTGSETKNVGEGEYFALHVRRESDEFYATVTVRAKDTQAFVKPAEEWIRTMPNELVLEPGPLLSGVGWFSDYELAKPGSYELRLVIWRPANFDFRSGSLTGPGIVAVSAPARFLVEDPSGVNRDAWEYYKASAGMPERASSVALMSPEAAAVVSERFPDSEYSRYTPLIAGLGKSGPEGLRFFQEALKRPLDPAVRDGVELAIATIMGDMGVGASANGKDLQSAMQLVAESRLRLDRLVANTRSPNLKQLAATELLRIPTPEKLAARAQEASATP